MSVLKVELLHPIAQRRLEALTQYCERRKLEPPAMTIDCTANAIQDQITYVRRLLEDIAADRDISSETKKDLSAFLADLSQRLKHVRVGAPDEGSMTSARIQAGKAIGNMHGTAVPAPKMGVVHISDDGMIELTIEPAVVSR